MSFGYPNLNTAALIYLEDTADAFTTPANTNDSTALLLYLSALEPQAAISDRDTVFITAVTKSSTLLTKEDYDHISLLCTQSQTQHRRKAFR